MSLAVEGKRVLVTRPVYGAKALSVWAPRTERQVTVLCPKIQPPAALDASRNGEVIPVPFSAPKSTVVAKLAETIRFAVAGVNLADARIIVPGGPGLGGRGTLQESA